MELQRLADEFSRVKGNRIVGVTVNYARELHRPTGFDHVAYVYNPAEHSTRVAVDIVNNLMDTLAFDTYTLGYTNKLQSLFVSNRKSFTYRELLSDIVESIEFHTVGC